MKSLQECQAEVFRRSEKRIKARKQRRKHMLMACIPMVAVGLCVAFALPGFYDPPKAAEAAPGAAGGLTADMVKDSVVEIQVEGVNVCYSYSSSTELQSITGQLEDFSTRAPTGGGFAGEVQENTTEETSQDDERMNDITDVTSPGYAITLVLDSGRTVEYFLFGNTLENITEGQIYRLTQAQVMELKTMLGIAQP